ncbi:MAG: hypothetical protein JSV27_10060 [Candidatus Bathyarchaeota archaeon]|nr:MAG: hypothetical protein JSV27_10060 [Candidatus Bathyarchaeota archaeon]
MVPMATEQSKVIAITVRGAGLVRQSGGFVTASTDPIEIGLIQMTDVPDYKKAMTELESRKDDVLALANTLSRKRRAVDLRTRGWRPTWIGCWSWSCSWVSETPSERTWLTRCARRFHR